MTCARRDGEGDARGARPRAVEHRHLRPQDAALHRARGPGGAVHERFGRSLAGACQRWQRGIVCNHRRRVGRGKGMSPRSIGDRYATSLRNKRCNEKNPDLAVRIFFRQPFAGKFLEENPPCWEREKIKCLSPNSCCRAHHTGESARTRRAVGGLGEALSRGPVHAKHCQFHGPSQKQAQVL